MKKWPTRPTMDQAKEALFNVLANHFDFSTISVLELFGGTGSISLEFISRGCTKVELVERYGPAIHFLKDLSKQLDINSELQLYKMDALQFLRRTDHKYDLVFMDPPYDYADYDKLVTETFNSDTLIQEGMLIIEHDARIAFSKHLSLVDHRKYGESEFSFFKF